SEGLAWSTDPTPSPSELGFGIRQALPLPSAFRSFDDPSYLTAPEAFYTLEP
ncbi:MAG: hypothetical protein FD187_3207, partial [bacterium]